MSRCFSWHLVVDEDILTDMPIEVVEIFQPGQLYIKATLLSQQRRSSLQERMKC